MARVLAQGTRRFDPYLAWALLTDSKGLGQPKEKARPWQIAAVLKPGTTQQVRQALREVGFHLDPEAVEVLHVTAQLTDEDFEAALVSDHIERLELSRPLADGTVSFFASESAPKRRPKLSGLVIAVIDDACAFGHRAFRAGAAGAWRSRIAYLWNQGGSADAPAPWVRPDEFGYGSQIGLAFGPDGVVNHIDALLDASCRSDGAVDEDALYASAGYTDQVAGSIAHGTHVLDLAAGRPNPLRPFGSGGHDDAAGATENIVFVQLPRATVDDTSGASMSFFVIDALRYVLNRVEDEAQLVVNLSYGSYAGAHDGTSILESAIDEVLDRRADCAVVLPAGNGYEANCHQQARLTRARPAAVIRVQIRADDPSDTFVELWWDDTGAGGHENEISVSVKPPGGAAASGRVLAGESRVWEGRGAWVEPSAADRLDPVCAVIRLPLTTLSNKPSSVALVALSPTCEAGSPRALAPHGLWEITVERVASQADSEMVVDAWIERDDQALGSARSRSQAVFCDEHGRVADAGSGRADQRETLSSLACGANTVVVGGCLLDGSELADYTAAGPGRGSRRPRGPDVVAPSDESTTVRGLLAAGNRSETWVRMNGTSVAAPIVARRLANLLAARAAAGKAPIGSSKLKQLLLREAEPALPTRPEANLALRRGGGFVRPAP